MPAGVTDRPPVVKKSFSPSRLFFSDEISLDMRKVLAYKELEADGSGLKGVAPHANGVQEEWKRFFPTSDHTG